MAENTSGHDWEAMATMEPQLSPAELALRDNFVFQYLIDFDPYQAAVRVGFLSNLALSYAQRFMGEGYVLRKIAELSRACPDNENEQRKRDESLTLNTLRQAMQNGPYASRVAAARELANILGLTGGNKRAEELLHRGGVMMVPAIVNVEEWQRAALASQETLVRETRDI